MVRAKSVIRYFKWWALKHTKGSLTTLVVFVHFNLTSTSASKNNHLDEAICRASAQLASFHRNLIDYGREQLS